MLAIRMQRTGRHGHAMFRMIVQDSRRTPTSGNIVAALGNYDPHTKTAVFDKEKASYYLEHGAQPSDRVIFILKAQGVKIPSWVNVDDKKTASIRNKSKLRRNRPAGEAAPAPQVEDEVVAPEVEAETAASATTEEAVIDQTPVVEAAPEVVNEVSETAEVEEVSGPVVEETPAREPEAEAVAPEVSPPETSEAIPDAAPAAEEPLEK